MPARPIRPRFPAETAARLQKLRWWDWPEEEIRARLPAIWSGDVDRLEDLAAR